VIANLLEAHALASAALRETDRVDADGDGIPALIGVAKHWVLLEPLRPWWPFEHISAAIQHGVFNVAVARALRGDPIHLAIPASARAPAGRCAARLLGFHRPELLHAVDGELARKGAAAPPPEAPLSDLGWEVYPEGLERALTNARIRPPAHRHRKRHRDAADRIRPGFIRESLAALDRARARGVDVRGYFHWSAS